ncbi:replication initiator protein [Dipodfec virus UOA04_Rod_967]|nr:replication initiator protein [Dipodfec virus UOA04_Rod_967]
MDCLNPIAIEDPDYYEYNDCVRSHGQPHLVKKILVPCGNCESCVYSDAQEWRVRLDEEMSVSLNAVFVTLTYNDDSLPFSVGTDFDGNSVYLPCVSKTDIQRFLKRLRWYYDEKYAYKGLRYFIVSEYGPTTFRPHYHGVLFNLPDFNPHSQKSLVEVSKLIAEKWDHGFVKVDIVNPERIGYVTKYICSKTNLPSGYVPPFRMMSTRPAIGSSYFDRDELIAWHKDGLRNYVPRGSYKMPMPRYYRRHIFDEDEQELLSQLSYLRREKHAADELHKDSEYYEQWIRGVDVRRNRINNFKRNFDRKYVKKRKDL